MTIDINSNTLTTTSQIDNAKGPTSILYIGENYDEQAFGTYF